ncbi:MAG: hypothetical protein SGPRY_000150 [Prymnesium sp.]
MRLKTPNIYQHRVDLKFPDIEKPSVQAQPTALLKKSSLSSLVTEANARFAENMSALSLCASGQRTRTSAECKVKESPQSKAAGAEVDATLVRIASLMQESSNLYRASVCVNSWTSPHPVVKEPSAKRGSLFRGGPGGRSHDSEAEPKRAAEPAKQKADEKSHDSSRARMLGIHSQDEFGREHLSAVQLQVRYRIKELREDPAKLEALQLEIERQQRRKRVHEHDSLRENIRAVKVSAAEYHQARERQIAERRLLEEQREQSVKARIAEQASGAEDKGWLHPFGKIAPFAHKLDLCISSGEGRKNKELLLRRQVLLSPAVPGIATGISWCHRLEEELASRQWQATMQAAALMITRFFRNIRMGARIHLIFKRTRILKYLVFRWRLRRRVEKKQFNVRILRSKALKLQKAWRHKAAAIMAQKLLILQAWLRRDYEQGLIDAPYMNVLYAPELKLRLSVVAADLWERRRVHVKQLNVHFQEVERRRKNAQQVQLMEDAKQLLSSHPAESNAGERTPGSLPSSETVSAEGPQFEMPIFKPLAVSETHFTKLTGKVSPPAQYLCALR